MAHSIEWKTGETSKLVSMSSYKDEASGKRKIKRNTVEVKYDYPVLTCDTPEDLAVAMQEVIDSGVVGFTSFKQAMDHINHGLYRSVAVALNRGVDPKLSTAQREAVKMYASLVYNGMGIDRDFAVATLERQGIADAGNVFDIFFNDLAKKDGKTEDEEKTEETEEGN